MFPPASLIRLLGIDQLELGDQPFAIHHFSDLQFFRMTFFVERATISVSKILRTLFDVARILQTPKYRTLIPLL